MDNHELAKRLEDRMNRMEDNIKHDIQTLYSQLSKARQEQHNQDIRITKIEHNHKWVMWLFIVAVPAAVKGLYEVASITLKKIGM